MNCIEYGNGNGLKMPQDCDMLLEAAYFGLMET